MVLTYDPATYQVRIGGDPLPLSLGQMILHEAQIQLELLRRVAAAAALQQQQYEQQRTQAVLDSVRTGRG